MATRTILLLRRALLTITKPPLTQSSVQRNFQMKVKTISSVRCVSSEADDKFRKVTEETVDDTTTVEASYSELPEEYLKVESNPHSACPICSRNLRVTYKDVLILSQFLNPFGGLLPRRLTGVCKEQQKVLADCLHKAHITGLIPDHKPPKVYGVFKEQNWKPRRKVKYNMY